MNILYAGPWVGEFGWELCWWNPLVRHCSQLHSRTIVAAPSSSRHLYEFADDFIPLETDGGQGFHMGKLVGNPPVVQADHHLEPSDVFHRDRRGMPWAKQRSARKAMPKKWHLLAPSGEVKIIADVLCAFRPIKQGETEEVPKHYPFELCERLVEAILSKGLSVACYGGTDNYFVPGTIDLRGVPLEKQCAALAAAKCAVGPSSGTIHLASLCGCPHVTWYTPRTHPDLHLRYESRWNHFGTAVVFLRQPMPSPEDITKAIDKLS